MGLILDGTSGISASGNITGGNIIVTGTFAPTSLSVVGNVQGAYILGNGSQLTGLPAGYANSDAAAYFASGTVSTAIVTTNGITATGNVSGGNVIATTAFVGSLTGTASFATTANAVAGANVSGTVGSATTAATVTTAAQPNITSVGTLSSLSVTGNIDGGNITTVGTATIGGFTIEGNTITAVGPTLTIDPNGAGGTDGLVVITGNLQVQGNATYINSNNITTNDLTINMANNAATASAANGGGIEVGPVGSPYTTLLYNSSSNIWVASNGLSVVGVVQTAGNIAGGNLSVTTGTVTAGNIVNGNGNGVGNIGATGAYFNTVFAKATSAQYADLAEMYCADAEYEPGTVVEFGGTQEVTQTTQSHSVTVAGIVSTNPSYLMNATLACENSLEIALVGRVPCQVVGTIRKGDRLVSSDTPGAATVLDMSKYEPGCIVGKALEDYNSTEVGTIEVAVGRI